MTKERLIVALVAGGFLLTAIEVRYLHRDVSREHWQAWIPIIYGFAAFVAGVAYLAFPAMRKVVGGVFLAGVLAGAFGFVQHTEGSPAEVAKLFTQVVVAKADGDDESRERGGEGRGGEEKSDPPALAPLGIAGLAAIGFVASSRRFT